MGLSLVVTVDLVLESEKKQYLVEALADEHLLPPKESRVQVLMYSSVQVILTMEVSPRVIWTLQNSLDASLVSYSMLWGK